MTTYMTSTFEQTSMQKNYTLYHLIKAPSVPISDFSRPVELTQQA